MLRFVPFLVAWFGGVAAAAEPALVGPVLGHVDERTAHIWLQPAAATEVTLTVKDPAGKSVFEQPQTAVAERDFCLTWPVAGLEPATGYAYSVAWNAGGAAASAGPWPLRTAPPADLPGRACLGFGSCANEKFPAIWERMAVEGVEAIPLCGDTPYIDTSDREKNRQRHRAFLSQPGLAEIARTRPKLGTWDDHDFGANDSDGSKVDRETIRTVFTEYRRQWEWLKAALLSSTAPFKVLATGMVWHDKPNREKDDWETYAHEREVLFDFLAANTIGGVVLLGGDVHVSLLLEHLPAARLGEPVFEYIVSPLHDSVIPSLVPTKDKWLLWSAVEPNVFLRMVADTTGDVPTLTSTWIKMDGQRLHEHVIKLDRPATRPNVVR